MRAVGRADSSDVSRVAGFAIGLSILATQHIEVSGPQAFGLRATGLVLLAHAFGLLRSELLLPVIPFLLIWARLDVADAGDQLAANLVMITWCGGLLVHFTGMDRDLVTSAIRLQLAVLYVGAGVAKLADPSWSSGVALDLLAGNQATFAAPGAAVLAGLPPEVVTALTRAVPVVELLLAVMILLPRFSTVVLVMATALHCGIALVMGIESFQAVALGAVAATCATFRSEESEKMLQQHRTLVMGSAGLLLVVAIALASPSRTAGLALGFVLGMFVRSARSGSDRRDGFVEAQPQIAGAGATKGVDP